MQSYSKLKVSLNTFETAKHPIALCMTRLRLRQLSSHAKYDCSL